MADAVCQRQHPLLLFFLSTPMEFGVFPCPQPMSMVIISVFYSFKVPIKYCVLSVVKPTFNNF